MPDLDTIAFTDDEYLPAEQTTPECTDHVTVGEQQENRISC